ncbi:MAG: type B 50S ribosomal protein L31 [Candidatus Walczuchella monophlebidarum]
MKKGIHPKNYRLVAFKDMSSEEIFLCRSTAETKDQIEIDNVKYPLIKIEISSSSHPFFIGQMRFVDTAGRVDKFITKYKNYGKTNF